MELIDDLFSTHHLLATGSARHQPMSPTQSQSRTKTRARTRARSQAEFYLRIQFRRLRERGSFCMNEDWKLNRNWKASELKS